MGYNLGMDNKVNFKVKTQSRAYAEGVGDALDMLVTALAEGGTIDALLDCLSNNARPETVARMDAHYAAKRGLL